MTLRKRDTFVASTIDSRATYLADVGQRNPSFGVSQIRPSAIPSLFGIGGIDLSTKGDGVTGTRGCSPITIGEIGVHPAMARSRGPNDGQMLAGDVYKGSTSGYGNWSSTCRGLGILTQTASVNTPVQNDGAGASNTDNNVAYYTLNLPFIQPYSLALFDAKGGKLMDISGNSPGDVNLGAMKSGVYLLSGQVDGLVWQRKLFLK